MKVIFTRQKDGTGRVGLRFKFGKKTFRGATVKTDGLPTLENLGEAVQASLRTLPVAPKGLENWASKRGTE